MKKTLGSLFIFAFIFLLSFPAHAQFSFEEMTNVKRVGDPQLSPNGKTIAFTIGVVDLVGHQ